MPLFDPKIKAILQEAGIGPVSQKPNILRSEFQNSNNVSITDKLELAGLGLDDTLASMARLRDTTENEGIKRSINETVLKMHGVLKDQAPPPSAITVNIIDKGFEEPKTINGINPIFVPRSYQETDKIQ